MPGEGRDARVVALLCAMTKDRALVVLGLSSKMRTRVRELEAAKVHGSVADKRAELAEVRAALLRRTNNTSSSSSSRCNTVKGKQSMDIVNLRTSLENLRPSRRQRNAFEQECMKSRWRTRWQVDYA